MAQGTLNIINQGFPSFRADLNSQLEALATNSSGATAPTTTYPHQWWLDTSTTPNTLRQRNAANNAWIAVGTFDQSTNTFNITADVVLYDNAASGLNATNVQSAIDELADIDVSVAGLFSKAQTRQVAWTKTGNTTAESQTDLTIEINDELVFIPEGTSITMPTLTAGTDYAIMALDDGTLSAQTSFTPPANGRQVGGFHFAPGGNASIDPAGNWNNHSGGNTTPQINEYSFYDLKWRPSVADPRGLTLVNESFWTGMYLMSASTTIAPLHKYNVNPARDGNPPQKPYGDGTTYGNARPMNIFECLAYYGFRAPNHNEFQLLALGVNEERSIGGSGPGNTGIVTDRGKNQQTSAWGVFDATGVLQVWGRDSLPDNVQDNNVTEGRSNNIWRISRFAELGGSWAFGSASGSRFAGTTAASFSDTRIGGRGVCDHLILD